MAETTIEWTATRLPDGRVLPGFSFNPWIGCQAVSAACDFCYAEARSKRYGEDFAHRRRTSPANWKLPLRWNREAMRSGIRRKVFCASLADVFDNQVPEEWRHDLWNLIAATPHLDWLLLTKRPQNIAKMVPAGSLIGWPNVWLGTTAENQEEAERRIPHLLAMPATVHFLSCEPLLGQLDLHVHLRCPTCGYSKADCSRHLDHHLCNGPGPRLDWVIAGGESGSHARPMHPDWARSLRDQCADASVPFHFKQWGEWAPAPEIIDAGGSSFHKFDDGTWCQRIGKHRAGRLLDGVEHNGVPA